MLHTIIFIINLYVLLNSIILFRTLIFDCLYSFNQMSFQHYSQIENEEISIKQEKHQISIKNHYQQSNPSKEVQEIQFNLIKSKINEGKSQIKQKVELKNHNYGTLNHNSFSIETNKNSKTTDNLLNKFSALEEKTSKMLKFMPQIDKSGNMDVPLAMIANFIPAVSGTNSKMYENKLKIIKDLDEKIAFLQNNLKQSHSSSQQIRNVERQINLNFKNYYEESIAVKKIQMNSSFSSFKASNKVIPERDEDFNNSLQLKKEDKEMNIFVCIPKLVYIDIPIQIYVPKYQQQGSLKFFDNIGSNQYLKDQDEIYFNSCKNLLNEVSDRSVIPEQTQSSFKSEDKQTSIDYKQNLAIQLQHNNQLKQKLTEYTKLLQQRQLDLNNKKREYQLIKEELAKYQSVNNRFKEEIDKLNQVIMHKEIQEKNYQKKIQLFTEERQTYYHSLVEEITNYNQELNAKEEEINSIISYYQSKDIQYSNNLRQFNQQIHSLNNQILFYQEYAQANPIQYYQQSILNLHHQLRQKQQIIANLTNLTQQYSKIIHQLRSNQAEGASVHKQTSILAYSFNQIGEQIVSGFKEQLDQKDQQLIDAKQKIAEYEVTIHKLNLNFLQYKEQTEKRTIKQVENLLKNNENDENGNTLSMLGMIDKLTRYLKIYELNSQKTNESNSLLANKLIYLNKNIANELLEREKELSQIKENNKKMKGEIKSLKEENHKLKVEIEIMTHRAEDMKNIKDKEKDYEWMIEISQITQRYEKEISQLKDKIQKLLQYTQTFEKNYISSLTAQEKSKQLKSSTSSNFFTNTLKSKQFNQNSKFLQSTASTFAQTNQFKYCSSVKNCNYNRIKHSNSIIYQNKNSSSHSANKFMNCQISLLDILKNNILTNLDTVNQFIKKFINFCINLQQKKIDFKIETIYVSNIQVKGQVEIYCKSTKSNSRGNVSYQSPEALKGEQETNSSMVWIIGVIIDQIFNESCFYHKKQDIITSKNNYYCREDFPFAYVLQAMLRKNIEERPTLKRVKQQLFSFL